MRQPTSIQTLEEPVETLENPIEAVIEKRIEWAIADLLRSLPDPSVLTFEERRGIIARYTAILEGNFIYWMSAALLSARSEEARAIIWENLSEEIRDCHPAMMRTFAIAAKAFPTDSDALAVDRNLANVRRFAGRSSGLRIILMMTFFESFLQRFMPFLAELARLQGSAEFEYTDVHGVCDIAHSKQLFRALLAEAAVTPFDCEANPFEGMDLLRTLILNIVQPVATRETVLAG
jgi:hypothetical protein